jgi:hypothetical protein
MDPLAKPWVAFLNQFADELHSHGMILSVFIDGCCGYTNPYGEQAFPFHTPSKRSVYPGIIVAIQG